MMAKPMKTLELHYPMIQFLIISDTPQIKLRNICSRDMFRPIAIARAKILFFIYLFIYLFIYWHTLMIFSLHIHTLITILKQLLTLLTVRH